MTSPRRIVLTALVVFLTLDISKGEPFTMTAVAVGAAGVISVFLAGGICLVKECCTERWISTNFTGVLCVHSLCSYTHTDPVCIASQAYIHVHYRNIL